MQEIRIFVASSNELRYERLILSEFELMLNQSIPEKNIKIIMEKWEHLDSSMGPQHKQDDYNDVLRGCDMCIALFWARFGGYTNIEFEAARQKWAEGGSLKNIYVYFKEPTAEKNMSEELIAFKQACKENSVSYVDFSDEEQLIYHVLTHVDAYCQENLGIAIARIEDNKLMVGHKAFVDLKDIEI